MASRPAIEKAALDLPTPALKMSPAARIKTAGKFFSAAEDKFFVRGVTYGTFGPNTSGEDYDREKVELDFRLMAKNGFNSVRTYTVPPLWLLDSAQANGLRVMVGLPWEQHITFLDEQSRVRSIRDRVRDGVRSCAGHPAVFCYAIGNEIPAPIVRWHGAKEVERFLNDLYDVAKAEDPEGLVTYVNYPSTEYLDVSFVDFLSFNVYLEDEDQLARYVARLQNIAGEAPLVLAEIGLDSRRNGLQRQATTLGWQVRTIGRGGAAGAFIFAWTDEWHRGGHEIDDWDFGLTTREREIKPALQSVVDAFAETPLPPDMEFPKISVVVCTYNGSRTIRDCLDGLTKLEYPNFEVIVVNDGSKDNTPEIVAEYPSFKLISTENRGLSNARNTGLEAATGEIIAYTDDDARPDLHWLHYLALTYATTDHAGVGGPNIAPPGDGWIAECVANAPGGPIHVLLDDTTAEHVPGCNCSFRTEALRQIGGWDPRFRSAGDDVDVCWRIQHMGWTIGFSPAAMVWHHRRNSIKDYWKQQIGYGRAESLLEQKWPEKYNAAGHLAWSGRLYGKGLTETFVSTEERIYHGRWGTAPFQSVYERAVDDFWYFPLMPEWYLVIGLLALLSIFGIFAPPLFVASTTMLVVAVGVVLVQAVRSASKATFPHEKRSWFERARSYGLTAFFHVLQPLARLKGRVGHGLTPWRRRGNPGYTFPWPRVRSIWSEHWRAPEGVLGRLLGLLEHDGAIVRAGGEFDEWDLEVRGGMMASARVAMTTEEHGEGKQLFKFRIMPRMSGKWLMLLAGLVLLAAKLWYDNFEGFSPQLISLICIIATSGLLLFLIYRECAGPFASICGALDDLAVELRNEISEDVGAAREMEQVIDASATTVATVDRAHANNNGGSRPLKRREQTYSSKGAASSGRL